MINQNRGRSGRRRTGSIVKRTEKFKDKAGRQKTRVKAIFARVTFAVTDRNGKTVRKDKLRRARSVTHAKELIQEMLRELEDFGDSALDHRDRTFNDLAKYYETHYLTEAAYVDGRKVSGLRSWATPTGFLRTLRAHFGKRRLIEITYDDIRKFRNARFKTATRGDIARHKRELRKNRKAELRVTRAVASTNRELALLRRMLNVALRQGWIRKHPMAQGESLISVAAEHKRERIITLAEEAKLLDACTGRREHLKVIVIAAVDSGLRKGELLKLRWSDIDFAKRVITVRAFNTKTMRERSVALTARLQTELEQLKLTAEREQRKQQHALDADSLVFGIHDNVKRSFHSARGAAGLPDVRFADLRHTCASRLISRGIPIMEVGRALGHTQANTTYRYINADADTARRAADALDAMRHESEALETQTTEAVN